MKKEGFEAWEIPHEAWEMKALDQIGRRVPAGNESVIPTMVEEMLGDLTTQTEAIRRVRDENVVNFGHAGGQTAVFVRLRLIAFCKLVFSERFWVILLSICTYGSRVESYE